MFLILDAPLESEELTFTCNTQVANTTDEAVVIASDPYCEVPQTETGGNSKYNFQRKLNLNICHRCTWNRENVLKFLLLLGYI